MKSRHLAFDIAKGLIIRKRSRNLKKKKWFIDREIINGKRNRGTNVWFAKHVANQQQHSFQVLSFDERETIGDVQSDLARGWRSDDSTKISRKGWTGEGWRRERESGGGEKEIKGTQKDRGTLCWVA